MIDSMHKNEDSPEIKEALRLESGWGEVDNCWGQLGYVNVMLYKPPEYDDVTPVWPANYAKTKKSRFFARACALPRRAQCGPDRAAERAGRPAHGRAAECGAAVCGA